MVINKLTRFLKSTFVFLILCFACPVIAQNVYSSNDSIKWNQWIDKAYSDANKDNTDTYFALRKEFDPSYVKYLEDEQCRRFVLLICYTHKEQDNLDDDIKIFDAIIDNQIGNRETYQYMVAYYDNFHVYPDKKYKLLRYLEEDFLPSAFVYYHLGKALVNGEGVQKNVQEGIDEWVKASQSRVDFGTMAKNGLRNLWLTEGAKYNNVLGRLLNEYDDAMIVDNHYWIKKDGRVGLADSLANIVLPTQYEDVKGILDHLFVVATPGGEQLVATGGKILSKDCYVGIELGKFGDGSYIIPVFDGEHYGVLNEKGELLTDMVFDSISLPMFSFSKPSLGINENTYQLESMFIQGVAIISENNKYGLLDKKGNLVLPCKYDSIELPRKGSKVITVHEGEKTFTVKK